MKVLRELYTNFNSGVLPFHKNSVTDVKREIRQGDTISSKIFMAALGNAMRKLESDDLRVKVFDLQLHHLRFAGDTVLGHCSLQPRGRNADRI
ncbi:hypothetical protein RB195_022869 [Necator americanus]|uniref:Reverse transcriptase domain-containing protein n=1 Tax=Necator americanus TaxID=51031 RepID=A0ABR1EH42_NECAM